MYINTKKEVILLRICNTKVAKLNLGTRSEDRDINDSSLTSSTPLSKSRVSTFFSFNCNANIPQQLLKGSRVTQPS